MILLLSQLNPRVKAKRYALLLGTGDLPLKESFATVALFHLLLESNKPVTRFYANALVLELGLWVDVKIQDFPVSAVFDILFDDFEL